MSQAIIKIMEGATTIPQGSTAQANGAGSARHLTKDDDIVCSLQQCKAALLKSGLSFANLDEHNDDQTASRFVMRVDGAPWWPAPSNLGALISDDYSKSCEFMEIPTYVN